LLTQGHVVDRYTVEGVIGRGGMAIVYRARHNGLGSTHAMKVIDLPSATLRERLIAEGRVQSALRHPNIAAVTDLIEVAGAPALIMEYVNGPAVDAVIAQGSLTLEQADHLARGIISGMAAAHRFGLVHRDLKPSNVMLAILEGELIPKIIDFGLVKDTEGDTSTVKTRTGMTMGTPSYMAPEQVRDAKNIDKRADIFALGAILYELVTGRRAFVGSDTFEVFRSIADGKYVDAAELVPDLPECYAKTIRKALQTNPEDRFPDCEALLQSWIEGGPAPALNPAKLWDSVELEGIQSREQERSSEELSNQASDETFALDRAEERSSVETLAVETWAEATEDLASGTCVEKVTGADRVTLKEAATKFILGSLFSIPFVFGVLILLFGDFAVPINDGGIWMLLMLPLTVCTFGVSMVLSCSKADYLGGWVVMPTLVLVAGIAGTIAGVDRADGVADKIIQNIHTSGELTQISELPTVVSYGVRTALVVAMAASAFSGVAFLSAAIIIASRAPGSWLLSFTRRRQMIAGAALGLGFGYLLIVPLIPDYPTSGPQGLFFVFLSVCGLGLAAARVSEGDPDDLALWRARWAVLLCGVLGVSLCWEAESIGATRTLFSAVGEEGTPLERVAASKEFLSYVDSITGFSLMGWMTISLLIVFLPMWGHGGVRCPVPWRRWALPIFLLTVRFVLTGIALQAIYDMGERVKSGQEAAAAYSLLGFIAYDVTDDHQSRRASSGIVVEAALKDLSIQDGDEITAVNNRPVDSVSELVEQIELCKCDDTLSAAAGCEFQWQKGEGGCLTDTCTVRMNVNRTVDSRPTVLNDLPVDLQGG
jgi:serine/threonine protein kinase